jgi:tRNA 2-selenouridine synthase
VVAEYGSLDKERMASAIQRIAKRLGPMETKTALQLLQEDNITECFRILLQYYDKQYVKGLQNRESLASVLTKINCEKVTVDNAALLSQAQAVI